MCLRVFGGTGEPGCTPTGKLLARRAVRGLTLAAEMANTLGSRASFDNEEKKTGALFKKKEKKRRNSVQCYVTVTVAASLTAKSLSFT